MVPYTLVRSARKSFGIYITDDAEVEVRAPLSLSKAAIDRLVKSKEDWIIESIELKRENIAQKAAFSLNYGDTVLLLAKEIPIIPREGTKAGCGDKFFFMPPGLSQDRIKSIVIQIYKIAAETILREKVSYYSKLMGVSALSMKVNNAKSRWGSCSGKRRLNFAWRVVMASETAVNYVVIHELAHLIELNHSKDFWKIVGEYVPDIPSAKQELASLQLRLQQEDWD